MCCDEHSGENVETKAITSSKTARCWRRKREKRMNEMEIGVNNCVHCAVNEWIMCLDFFSICMNRKRRFTYNCHVVDSSQFIANCVNRQTGVPLWESDRLVAKIEKLWLKRIGLRSVVVRNICIKSLPFGVERCFSMCKTEKDTNSHNYTVQVAICVPLKRAWNSGKFSQTKSDIAALTDGVNICKQCSLSLAWAHGGKRNSRVSHSIRLDMCGRALTCGNRLLTCEHKRHETEQYIRTTWRLWSSICRRLVRSGAQKAKVLCQMLERDRMEKGVDGCGWPFKNKNLFSAILLLRTVDRAIRDQFNKCEVSEADHLYIVWATRTIYPYIAIGCLFCTVAADRYAIWFIEMQVVLTIYAGRIVLAPKNRMRELCACVIRCTKNWTVASHVCRHIHGSTSFGSTAATKSSQKKIYFGHHRSVMNGWTDEYIVAHNSINE